MVDRQEQKPVMDNNQCDKYSLVDFSLEEVEEEIRLEKIRQSSLKFSWEYLSQLLRRNLMVCFLCDNFFFCNFKISKIVDFKNFFFLICRILKGNSARS